MFKLTENATSYAQSIDWGKLEEARAPLRKIIDDYSLFKKSIDYVKIHKSVSRDDLVARIAVIAGAPKKVTVTRV